MKKLTTKFMIATAALVVAAGAASAQIMTASIPFEFRAGNRVMAPGTYRVDAFTAESAHRSSGFGTRTQAGRQSLLAQAPVDPRKAMDSRGEREAGVRVHQRKLRAR